MKEIITITGTVGNTITIDSIIPTIHFPILEAGLFMLIPLFIDLLLGPESKQELTHLDQEDLEQYHVLDPQVGGNEKDLEVLG
tara:strand:- start:999 stop:1247 length:249 start_codon:yes stop_codon:yes gene_type:complete